MDSITRELKVEKDQIHRYRCRLTPWFLLNDVLCECMSEYVTYLYQLVRNDERDSKQGAEER